MRLGLCARGGREGNRSFRRQQRERRQGQCAVTQGKVPGGIVVVGAPGMQGSDGELQVGVCRA